MARKPSNGADPQWRNNILEATRRCLSAKGFHDVTIDDITRGSLTPRSVLYRYFQNKDALLDETFQRSSQQTLSIMAQVLSGTDAGSGSAAQLIELLEPVLASPSAFDIGRFNIEWWAWSARSEIGLKGFRQVWREWRETLMPVVRSELGEDAPEETVQAMASLMLAIFNGLLLHATLEGEELDLDLIMRLQRYGWEGIMERVDKEEPQPKTLRKKRAR
jgi:AcrR family transcriptional regulator